VHLEDPEGGAGLLLLFAVLSAEAEEDEELRPMINRALRESLTPRHIPDLIVVVPSVPRTKTGKKLEIPVKRILQGHDAAELASISSLDDPHVLDAYAAFAATLTDDRSPVA
jgi:acetoacetyl-CoA synthetase